MQGRKHTVESFKEKYYILFPESTLEILEILPKEKIRCKDKYSEYITYTNSLVNGHLPHFSISLNKKEHFTNRAIEVHGNKYDYSKTEINKLTDKVQISCKKHGLFYQRASSHLFGQGCNECGILDTVKLSSSCTSDFIKKANIKHNNFYDYSLVQYVNTITKVKIICPLHKVFEQIPNSHLNGKGCKECAKEVISKYNSENPSSWNYTNWESAGKKSKNFDSFKVYIIRCFNETEEFYKIGKTYRKVEKRFASLIKMPYKFEIIKVIEGTSREISELEKKLQKLNKDYKYIPNILFKGNNECYSKIK